jgi:hypothetical protein
MQIGVVEMGDQGSIINFSGSVNGDKFPANDTYVRGQTQMRPEYS